MLASLTYGSMCHRTLLSEPHQQLATKLNNIVSRDMTIHYGYQMAEYHSVRKAAGVFDVSTTVLELGGVDIVDIEISPDKLLANYIRILVELG